MFFLSEILRVAGYASPVYELPLTGGSGPLVVTAIGVSLAGLSVVLFVMRGKSDKQKNRPKKRNY